MLNFHGHSQCSCINVARLSVLYYATVAHVVNIPVKSMSTGYKLGLEVTMPSNNNGFISRVGNLGTTTKLC